MKLTLSSNRLLYEKSERECRFRYCKLWSQPNDSDEWVILHGRRFCKTMPCKNDRNCVSPKSTLVEWYFTRQEHCCWTDWWCVKIRMEVASSRPDYLQTLSAAKTFSTRQTPQLGDWWGDLTTTTWYVKWFEATVERRITKIFKQNYCNW